MSLTALGRTPRLNHRRVLNLGEGLLGREGQGLNLPKPLQGWKNEALARKGFSVLRELHASRVVYLYIHEYMYKYICVCIYI